MGAFVVSGCRNLNSGEEVKKKIMSKISKNGKNGKIIFFGLDLSDLASVKSFSEKVLSLNQPIKMIINNAGIMMCPHGLTKNGYEIQFGTNHIGHFFLTQFLLNNILNNNEEDKRIINISSLAHSLFEIKEGIDFSVLKSECKKYSEYTLYGISKLSNILFTKKLNELYKEKKIFCFAVP
jgi:retinol dehydrogenase 12